MQVTKFGGPLTGSPHWSPDGAWIAFDSRPMGNGDIFVVPSGGGAARRITSHHADDVTPSWSNDGRSIYFASNRTGTYQVWKIAADAGETTSQPVQVTHQGGFLAQESASDRSLFYAKGPRVPGIWKLTPDGQEAPVLQDYPGGYWGYWCVQDGGLYFVTPTVAEGAVLRVSRPENTAGPEGDGIRTAAPFFRLGTERGARWGSDAVCAGGYVGERDYAGGGFPVGASAGRLPKIKTCGVRRLRRRKHTGC